MRWNVVELASNGLYAKVYRGFLVVMRGEEELGRVVIDELNCLLLTAEQSTLSKPVMVHLAEAGVPIVVCGENYHPHSLCLPYGDHYQTTGVLQQQMAASLPLRKRLWQALVKAKIAGQQGVLLAGQPGSTAIKYQFDRMLAKVRSGDPDNIEAQAARHYWHTLFGESFRRRPEAGDITNKALNYGYSIMRAACARAVVAAGLHPALGLHHSNQSNPFCLADDLMEIYRPLVDRSVLAMGLSGGESDLQPGQKQQLARLLQQDVWQNGQLTTAGTSMQQLAFSLVTSYREKNMRLQLPDFRWGGAQCEPEESGRDGEGTDTDD